MTMLAILLTLTLAADPVPPRHEENCNAPPVAPSHGPQSSVATISVTWLEDPIDAKPSDCKYLEAADDDDALRGICSLRAAMLLANTLTPAMTSVTIMLGPGSILLRRPLPEVRGALAIVGFTKPIMSLPDSLGSMDSPPADAKTAQAARAPSADTRAKRASTINGVRRHQLLSTALGSSLLLRNVELVNGWAPAQPTSNREGFERPRASLGGAVNALGELVLDDVGLRRNTAEYGGAIYFEGANLAVSNTVIEHNVAQECGGAVYVAGGANANFYRCEIVYNHDKCKTRTVSHDTTGAEALGSSALSWFWSGLAPRAAATTQTPTAPKKSLGELPSVDVSGAVAQGPKLVPSTVSRPPLSIPPPARSRSTRLSA
jgi:hypothetical protein